MGNRTSDPKPITLKVRISPSDLSRIEAFAHKSRLTLSDAVRAVIRALPEADARTGAIRRSCMRFIDDDLTDEEVIRLYAYLRNKGMPEAKPQP